jgi:molybdenum cofactor synthesis domain-containing protein
VNPQFRGNETMCDGCQKTESRGADFRTIPITEAVGLVLAHDITEIRPGQFKGRAFKKGHRIRPEDICHLQRLGKERLFVLEIAGDELHEDDAAWLIAKSLMGEGVAIRGEPKEGKIEILADRDGLLKIHREALLKFNLLGDVMCATLHDNTLVKKGQTVAGTRAIPLVVKKKIVEEAVRIAQGARQKSDASETGQEQRAAEDAEALPRTGVIEVRQVRSPRAGIVITGNEIYHGRIQDAFAPILVKKMEQYGGEIVGIQYAPDDVSCIEERLRDLLTAGADLLLATGGMSVDPDDVTRLAIRRLGATGITYGSAVLPGAMVLGGNRSHPALGDRGPESGERSRRQQREHGTGSAPLPSPICRSDPGDPRLRPLSRNHRGGFDPSENSGRGENRSKGACGTRARRPVSSMPALSVPGVPLRQVRIRPNSFRARLCVPPWFPVPRRPKRRRGFTERTDPRVPFSSPVPPPIPSFLQPLESSVWSSPFLVDKWSQAQVEFLERFQRSDRFPRAQPESRPWP